MAGAVADLQFEFLDGGAQSGRGLGFDRDQGAFLRTGQQPVEEAPGLGRRDANEPILAGRWLRAAQMWMKNLRTPICGSRFASPWAELLRPFGPELRRPGNKPPLPPVLRSAEEGTMAVPPGGRFPPLHPSARFPILHLPANDPSGRRAPKAPERCIRGLTGLPALR